MDNESTITVRLPRELKEKLTNFAEVSNISTSTVVREALEAHVSGNSAGTLLQGTRVSQEMMKQIRYLHYLVDNDDNADDYQTNLVIRKEVKFLWKLCCQNLASMTPGSQKETTQS